MGGACDPMDDSNTAAMSTKSSCLQNPASLSEMMLWSQSGLYNVPFQLVLIGGGPKPLPKRNAHIHIYIHTDKDTYMHTHRYTHVHIQRNKDMYIQTCVVGQWFSTL